MSEKSKTTELLPCPFCGSRDAKVTKHFKEDMWRFLHRCPIMGVLEIDWKLSVDDIAEMWNTRSAARD